MKFSDNYRLYYEDDISIQKKDENGLWQDLCSVGESTAMAWEGLERGLSPDYLAETICNEFDGAAKEQVMADLQALTAQLRQMGVILDEDT